MGKVKGDKRRFGEEGTITKPVQSQIPRSVGQEEGENT